MTYSRIEHFEKNITHITSHFIFTLFIITCITTTIRKILDYHHIYSIIDYSALYKISLATCLIITMRVIDLRIQLIEIKNRNNLLTVKFVFSLVITIFALEFQKWDAARNIDEKNFPVVYVEQFKGWDKVNYVKLHNITPLNEKIFSISSTLEWIKKGYQSGAYTQFLVTHAAPIDLSKNIWITETFEQNLPTSLVKLESDLSSYTELTHRIFTSRDYKIFSYFKVLKPSKQMRALQEKTPRTPTPVFVQPVYFSYEEESKKTIYYLLYISIPSFISIIVLLFFKLDVSQLERYNNKALVRRWL